MSKLQDFKKFIPYKGKMSEVAQKNYNVLKEATEGWTDWSFLEDEYDSFEDNVEKLLEWFELEAKEKASTPKKKPTPVKKAPAKPKAKPTKVVKSDGKKTVKQEYKSVFASEVNNKQAHIYKIVNEAGQTFYQLMIDGMVKKNGTYQDLRREIEEMRGNKKLKKKPTAKKAPVKKTTTKKAVKKAATKKPVAKKSDTSSCDNQPRFTQDTEVQVKLLKRWLSMNGKDKTIKSLRLLYNAITRAFAKGDIGKKSMYAKELADIQSRLEKVVDKSGLKDEDLVTVELKDKDLLCSMIKAVSSQKVYPSVRLLSRYVSIQGKSKSEIKPKAVTLQKALKKQLDAQSFRAHDPLYLEVKEIKKRIDKFLKAKGNAELPLMPASLNGLSGLFGEVGSYYEEQAELREWAKKKSLMNEMDSRIVDVQMPIQTQIEPGGSLGSLPVEEGVISSMDILDTVNDSRKPLPINAKYQDIVGSPKDRFVAMLHGVRGGGKTTFLLKFANDYAKAGKRVGYWSNEEIRQVYSPQQERYVYRMESTLQARVNQTGAKHQNITFLGKKPVALYAYDLIIVDSVSYGNIDERELEQMLRDAPNTSFIFIFHQKKDGSDYTGKTAYQHLVDMVWELDKGEGFERIITVVDKNRHAFVQDGKLIGEGIYKFELGKHE